MNNKILALIAMSLLTCSSCSKEPRQIYSQIPNITSQTLDGQNWTLAEQKDKVILVEFWATWCHYCKKITPELKQIESQFGQRDDFLLLGVAVDKQSQTVKNYCQLNDITWMQIHEPPDTFDSLTRTFNVKYLPSMWLVHKDGSVEKFNRKPQQIERALARKNIL